MDEKDKDLRRAEREAERERQEGVNDDLIENKLKEDEKERFDNGTRKVNRLWIWFGILILIVILLYWLFSIGMFEDITGVTNG